MPAGFKPQHIERKPTPVKFSRFFEYIFGACGQGNTMPEPQRPAWWQREQQNANALLLFDIVVVAASIVVF